MARRSIRTGSPMNLATNLEASACFFPDNPAVRQGNLVSTHAQLNERANRIPTGLMKMGVASGEHVGLCALNSADSGEVISAQVIARPDDAIDGVLPKDATRPARK